MAPGPHSSEGKSGAGRVRVLLFATARTAVGERSLSVPVDREGLTARALVAQLAASYPRLAPVLPHCRFFHDGEPIVRLDERVRAGDEFAVHPPYGGG